MSLLLRALLVRPTQAWQDWYCGRAKYQFWAGNDVSTIGAVTSKFVRSVDPQRSVEWDQCRCTHVQRVPESFT
jgi:hypothetical protein